MMVIFHDVIEETMAVFMDDFSVFEDSFSSCLSHLDKMLKRCEDTTIPLYFMDDFSIRMDRHTSLGRLCMDEHHKISLNDMIESEGNWSGPEYLDTADSGEKKEVKAITFHRMETVDPFLIDLT
ncbi:hypothetical protein Tco_0904321 [Tanacetum coccineum]